MNPNDIEVAKLALETRKVVLEERKERRERSWGWITRLGIAVPLMAAVIAAIISGYIQRDAELGLQKAKAQDDFEARAAEIVMNTNYPSETQARALALAALFPQQLGEDFALQFEPASYTDGDEFQRDQRIVSKKELLALLAEHPDQKSEIIALWRALFPGDVWVSEVP